MKRPHASFTLDGVTVTICACRVERDAYEWDAHIEVSAKSVHAGGDNVRDRMIAGFTATLDKLIEQNKDPT